MNIEKFNLLTKIIWYIFFGIGYLFLYWDYFNPNEWGKKRNTAITARRLRAKHLWGPINAVIFYLFIISVFVYF